MKSFIKVTFGLTLAFIMITAGCENDYPPSVWDPNYNSKPTPVIDSVDPAFSFSGIGEITLTGSNFSPEAAENTVYFNGKPGKTLSATTTQIIAQAPVLVTDSATIKVHVVGAYLYGEFKPYQLKEAAITFKSVDNQVDAYALAVGPDESIYYIANNKIFTVTDPESLTAVEYGTTTFSICDNMRWAPDGSLYLLRGNRFIYRVEPGGGAAVIWVRFADVNDRVSTGDFDQDGNLYCGGRSQKIFTFSAAGDTTTAFRFPEYRYMAIRVYDGYVYTAAKYDGDGTPNITEGIWRHQILDAAGTLGAQELVYDWGTYAGELGPSILSLEFDENGLMYIGLDKDNAIMNLAISGGTPTPLYPEILIPPTTNMTWGNSTYVYINRHETDPEQVDNRRIIRLEMPLNGAPSYGRP